MTLIPRNHTYKLPTTAICLTTIIPASRGTSVSRQTGLPARSQTVVMATPTQWDDTSMFTDGRSNTTADGSWVSALTDRLSAVILITNQSGPRPFNWKSPTFDQCGVKCSVWFWIKWHREQTPCFSWSNHSGGAEAASSKLRYLICLLGVRRGRVVWTSRGGGAYQLYGSFPSLSNEAKFTKVSAPQSLKEKTPRRETAVKKVCELTENKPNIKTHESSFLCRNEILHYMRCLLLGQLQSWN